MATTTISGTTDIQDASIYKAAATKNYGGDASGNRLYNVDASTRANLLMRVATSAIPSGTRSAFRLLAYTQATFGAGYIGDNGRVYIVKAGNSWVEGTGGGGNASGDCSWNYAVHTSVPWLGSAGCETSGTDYDADASAPQIGFDAVASYTLETVSLPVAWVNDWKNSVRENAGMVLNCVGTGASTQGGILMSTEAGSNQPTFEVDWTSGVSASISRPSAFNTRRTICR